MQTGFTLDIPDFGSCFFDGAVILIACDNPRANELTVNSRGQIFVCRKCGHPEEFADDHVHQLLPQLKNDDIGLDVRFDTPIERLHVFFLGIVKRFWRKAVVRLTMPERCLLAVMFNTASLSGLGDSLDGVKAVFCQGGFTGKDWRVISHFGWILLCEVFRQDVPLPPAVLIFRHISLLHQLVMQEKLNVENLHLLGDTCNAIIQMVNSVADFTELRNVHKLHLLRHFVEDIQRFGPLGKCNLNE